MSPRVVTKTLFAVSFAKMSQNVPRLWQKVQIWYFARKNLYDTFAKALLYQLYYEPGLTVTELGMPISFVQLCWCLREKKLDLRFLQK